MMLPCSTKGWVSSPTQDTDSLSDVLSAVWPSTMLLDFITYGEILIATTLKVTGVSRPWCMRWRGQGLSMFASGLPGGRVVSVLY